jgi:exo-1,4-beta-D-glucosaminidase
MKQLKIFSSLLAAGILFLSCTRQTSQDIKILLKNDWSIQSSKEIEADGSIISTTAFQPEKWYPATVPSTVFGTLVENKVYPDPYFGTNIESVPGYIRARRGEIPDDSPFRSAWWYRTTFSLPKEFRGKNIWIKFHSINYKANIWLNGTLIADTASIEGAYRLYNLEITKASRPGKINCLALEIFPPLRLTGEWASGMMFLFIRPDRSQLKILR